MKKRCFLLFVVSIIIMGTLCGCVVNSESEILTTMAKAQYLTMDFILSNNYGNEITDLKYTTDNGKNEISFTLKKVIKCKSFYNSRSDMGFHISFPADEKYINDVAIAAAYGSSESDKTEITAALSTSIKNSTSSTFKIGDIGNCTIVTVNGNTELSYKPGN